MIIVKNLKQAAIITTVIHPQYATSDMSLESSLDFV